MKLVKVAKGQSGFTLIELMIVVGIIGILVAIAAPNFQRYQSKARQSEAKISLGAIYAAEKSFYSEYSAYHTNMNAIGYQPEGNKRYYRVGFASDMAAGQVSGFDNPTAPTYTMPNLPSGLTAGDWISSGAQSYWPVTASTLPATWGGAADALTGTGTGATTASASGGANPQGFIAGAAGNTRNAAPVTDQWRMDDTKTMKNSTPSL